MARTARIVPTVTIIAPPKFVPAPAFLLERYGHYDLIETRDGRWNIFCWSKDEDIGFYDTRQQAMSALRKLVNFDCY